MSYNTKNHTEQDGEKTIIGGELNIAEDGRLTFAGEVLTPAPFQASSIAEDVPGLVSDFNALLAKLKTSGLMKNE